MNSSEENELRKLQQDVEENPDDYEAWAKFVTHAEGVDGGLHRNSSPEHIKLVRDIYDRFLAKFPLFFGYWKKYADLEFNIAGPEAAENIYERGIASVPSVDLWTHYCSFKAETTHDADIIRELFERAAGAIGLDFLAHPFWDKYIEFEERQEAPERVLGILARLIHIPMHQYARYYERFRQVSATRPVNELGPSDLVAQYRAEITMSLQNADPQQIDNDVRARFDTEHYEIFQRTQTETTKRWTYESEIKRPYFHVTPLDDTQLSNWRKYLDFEQAEGNYQRTAFLYERCLVACAHYADLWLRYARWMASQPDKAEETRHIYMRASYLYAPIAEPEIRLKWALFEESQGRVSTAHDIYDSILIQLPGHIETIIAWANSARRNYGIDAAIHVYRAQIGSDHPSTPQLAASQSALIRELALLVYKFQGATQEARACFMANQERLRESPDFWVAWLMFENELITPTEEDNKAQYDRLKAIFSAVRSSSALAKEAIEDISAVYLKCLSERGGSDAAKEAVQLDRDIYGPLNNDLNNSIAPGPAK